jgi:DNA mismatch repair protein MutS
VILDEIGRGTSTLDGLSLAWAIAECLAGDAERPGPRTLFATHYHEITGTGRDDSPGACGTCTWRCGSGRRTTAARRSCSCIRSVRGRADQSYGVHVAELAGVPRAVTARAREVLSALSVQHARVETARVEPPRKRGRADGQLGLFTEFLPHPVVDELREIKLDAMTPMQAFDALRKLAEKARGV